MAMSASLRSAESYVCVIIENPLGLIVFLCMALICLLGMFFFFFNDPAPPEISPLPLPDALPICANRVAAATLDDAAVAGVADILIAVHAMSAAALGKAAGACIANPGLAADGKAAAGERIAEIGRAHV